MLWTGLRSRRTSGGPNVKTDEHKMTGACESLKAGLKAWLASDYFAQRRGNKVALPKSTKTIIVDED
jgi:hypothetical protein